jgi:N-acetyl-1-D-myo-inositol-2-amino-2-deoxy-alpha-D-glucopyranoside deacetylase
MARRIARVVQSFLGGAVIALIATVVHSESFPFVLIGALVVVGLFLVSLRLLTDDRIVTVSGALGVLVTVLILAQRSTGGSVLIAANDAGNAWVIGVSLLSGLASAWPQLPARHAG